MAKIRVQDRSNILQFVNAIPEDYLYKESGPNSYGRETECHVTVLYGLAPDIQTSEIVRVLQGTKPIQLELGTISTFNQKLYDVLKIDVISPDLQKLNKQLCTLPYETNFPDYRPHLTLGYIKKGKVEHLLQRPDIFRGKKLISDIIEISFGDHRETEYIRL